MYSILIPHQKSGFKESDILQFPWDNDNVQELSEREVLEMQEQEERSRKFFEKFDLNTAAKA